MLAKKIKKAAREHGTNIKEISCQLGVRPNNLSRTINNPNITYTDLQKIATAIGSEIEDILTVDKVNKVNKVINCDCPTCGERLDISISVKITPSKER